MNPVSKIGLLALCLFLAEWGPVLAQSQEPDGTAANTAAAAGSQSVSAHFLLPAEGDVYTDSSCKLVAVLNGPAPHSIGVVLDGRPLPWPVTLRKNILTAPMEYLSKGLHRLTVLFFNRQKEILYRKSITFVVRKPESQRKIYPGDLRYFGRVIARTAYKGEEAGSRLNAFQKLTVNPSTQQLEAEDRQRYMGKNLDGNLQGVYNMAYNRWEGSGKLIIRSNESAFRQPAHRFSGSMNYRPWVYLKAGDVYPDMNELVLSNTRIRGMESKLKVNMQENPLGSFQMAYGQSKRLVHPHVIEYQSGDTIRMDSLPGTYRQYLSAARLGLGGGPNFKLGLTLLKAWDEIGSLDPWINDRLFGPSPAQNLVSGIDFQMGFWEGKVQLFADGALSFHTRNTRIGPLDTSQSQWMDMQIKPWVHDVIMINPTTEGLAFLDAGDNNSFLKENSHYQMGVKVSAPFTLINSETELIYSHLGLFYHSEGNRFLGSVPEYGWSLLQKFRSLDSKMRCGFRAGRHIQKFGLTQQMQNQAHATMSYAPSPSLPSMWLGVGRTWSDPLGEVTFLHISSNVTTMNAGGYYQFTLPDAYLHSWLSYYFTRSKFNTYGTTPLSNLARTNIITSAWQYKQKRSHIIPRFSYTYADNGVQKPTSNVTMGVQNSWYQRRLTLDASLHVGQYPESDVQNDLKLGESAYLTYHLNAGHHINFHERWLQYGNRKHIVFGVNYDMYF
jgi:hypothetical protein